MENNNTLTTVTARRLIAVRDYSEGGEIQINADLNNIYEKLFFSKKPQDLKVFVFGNKIVVEKTTIEKEEKQDIMSCFNNSCPFSETLKLDIRFMKICFKQIFGKNEFKNSAIVKDYLNNMKRTFIPFHYFKFMDEVRDRFQEVYDRLVVVYDDLPTGISNTITVCVPTYTQNMFELFKANPKLIKYFGSIYNGNKQEGGIKINLNDVKL